jgi:hypothetical protein
VVKKSLYVSANSSIIAAGSGLAGATSTTLHSPGGIFVDTQLNLYVADTWNSRIQFFESGFLNATTVAMNGVNGTFILNQPIGIVLDADGYLFISDSYNNRIIGSSVNGFRCIVGCTGLFGTAANQLYIPVNLRFDSYGNLFVVDQANYRIQKFFLESNSCSKYKINFLVSFNNPFHYIIYLDEITISPNISISNIVTNTVKSTVTTNIATTSYQHQTSM